MHKWFPVITGVGGRPPYKAGPFQPVVGAKFVFTKGEKSLVVDGESVMFKRHHACLIPTKDVVGSVLLEKRETLRRFSSSLERDTLIEE